MAKKRWPQHRLSKGKGELLHQPVFMDFVDVLPEPKVKTKRKKKLWRA